jgi:hypothetical protein
MDALARLNPVAAPLLRDVDEALGTLGAPPTHPVWRMLGHVGALPSDVVAFLAEWEPSRLRAAATTLRVQAQAYTNSSIPAEPPWEGETAQRYAVTAAAVREHLAGGAESMAARLGGLASYVDAVADWQQSLRDEMARTLATVLTSSQAVTLRAARRPRAAETDGLTAAVTAAADIGAAVLGVAQDAAAAGERLARGAGALDELPYRPPAQPDPVSYLGPIRLH